MVQRRLSVGGRQRAEDVQDRSALRLGQPGRPDDINQFIARRVAYGGPRREHLDELAVRLATIGARRVLREDRAHDLAHRVARDLAFGPADLVLERPQDAVDLGAGVSVHCNYPRRTV